MVVPASPIHVRKEHNPATGSIVAPIYQTSTYVNEELGKNKGYDYARTNHPNRKALERTVAKLEGGHAAYVFTSGMAGGGGVVPVVAAGGREGVFESGDWGGLPVSTAYRVRVGLGVEFV